MRKSVNIITSNKTLYHLLNKLHFQKEIIIDKKDSKFINRIVKNINFKENKIKIERNGNFIKLIKINPIRLNIFLKNK